MPRSAMASARPAIAQGPMRMLSGTTPALLYTGASSAPQWRRTSAAAVRPIDVAPPARYLRAMGIRDFYRAIVRAAPPPSGSGKVTAKTGETLDLELYKKDG